MIASYPPLESERVLGVMEVRLVEEREIALCPLRESERVLGVGEIRLVEE